MILAYCPQEINARLDNGKFLRLLSFKPTPVNSKTSWDLRRVYLGLEEAFVSLIRDCGHAKIPPPVLLSPDFLQCAPRRPQPLQEFLLQDAVQKETVSVCLINGGGGGLGDGIMFAPALEILAEKLAKKCGAKIQLDVFTMLPERTGSVLGHLPYVSVRSLPMPVSEFIAYDAYADFSDLLSDDYFKTNHMTDYALHHMGIPPGEIAASEKEPFLPDPVKATGEVAAALALARRSAADKLLVAFIFRSSYARTMSEEKAAEILASLAEQYQPVILMAPPFSGIDFIRRYDLQDRVLDLSSSSGSFANYMALLAGMDAIVSVDTSAVHIGGALGKPTVGIFNSIRKELRIKYSPTVQGIQLDYEGGTCHGPCGISKSGAFVKGKLPDGRPFRLDFGYPCDEAVDKDTILSQVIEEVEGIDPNADLDKELEAIRRKADGSFSAKSAPCWESLKVSDIMSALAEALARARSHTDEFPCPVCNDVGRHRRFARIFGRIRFYCESCQADFFKEKEVDGPPVASSGTLLPLPHVEERKFVQQIFQQTPDGNSVLWIETGLDGWDDFWQEGSFPQGFQKVNWRHLDAAHFEDIDFVVVLGVLEILSAPREFIRYLLQKMGRRRPLFCFLTVNKNGFWPEGDEGGSGSELSSVAGWSVQTHKHFLKETGFESVWASTTPVWEGLFHPFLVKQPPLLIQPPGLNGTTIQLAAKELAAPFYSYLSGVSGNGPEGGRFFVSLDQPGRLGSSEL